MELERSMKESDMKALELIQDVTRNCNAVQAKVLAEILTCNADTEYLKRHRLEGRTDCHSFKARVPVVDYEDILPDIKRIANGDSSSILSSHRITEFFTSSATSGGECKLLPATQEEFDKKLLFRSLVTPVMNMYFPGLDKGKALYFQCIMAGTKTRGGLVAQPALSSWYKSDHFKNFMLYSQHTSPIELVLCLDSFQSLYSQLLAGLYQRLDVLRVGATFALGLIQAIQFLHLHHLEICQDIATGILSPKITDPSVRGAMSKIMKPDPNLARTIKEECSRENWVCGIIKRIWPNTKCLDATVTGTMAQYIPTLNLYSGGLPKASMVYAASEGLFGINLKPMASPSEVSYTIMPNMAYFEFIPLDDDNSSLLVDLEDVQVGKEYEPVITTYAGLYRYRVGDILRVTGFHNSTPEFRFVCRKNVLLSIDVDKTNEVGLQKAIDKASVLLHKRSNASIAEYTSYADTTTTPGHYVIYWELTMPIDDDVIVSDELLGRCCLEMEESLGGLYRMCRVARGSMGPLEIRIVSSGTFDELMVDALSRGASIHQYKVPRCISFLPIVKLLDRRVVSAHFSPNLPRWSSDDLADTQVQPPT